MKCEMKQKTSKVKVNSSHSLKRLSTRAERSMTTSATFLKNKKQTNQKKNERKKKKRNQEI